MIQKQVAVEVKNCGLVFDTSLYESRYLKETLVGLFRKTEKSGHRVEALKDVSFRLESGDRLGVIGPNGAGKTTLLRVISGIYTPTQGNVRVWGKVSALFSLATGFEMNSTGWHNIYVRGLLLGLSTEEIQAQIHEIAEFSELGEFLDMPVRCYSSGMLLRLAFSVSTVLRPEILLLDEVIGAGDLHFTRKAGDRMKTLVERSGILILVSHSLEEVERMCNRCLWLEKGQIRGMGAPAEVVAAYREATARSEQEAAESRREILFAREEDRQLLAQVEGTQPSPPLQPERKYTLQCTEPGWNGLSVVCGTHQRNSSGTLSMDILHEGQLLRRAYVDMRSLTDNSVAHFRFPPLTGSAGKEFEVIFRARYGDSKSLLSLYEIPRPPKSLYDRVRRRLAHEGGNLHCRLYFEEGAGVAEVTGPSRL
jgi:ABC-2 type transport system ATP-binding protein